MNNLKLYEIINPSDPYTLETKNFRTACVAICILGNGQYGLKEIGGNDTMPLFILSGHDEWFQETFGRCFQAIAEGIPKASIANVLDSVFIGDATDRRLLNEIDPKKRDEWKKDWDKRNRSSINNIGDNAHQWAEKLRT